MTEADRFLMQLAADLEQQARADAIAYRRLMATGGPVAVAGAKRRELDEFCARLREASAALAELREE